MRIVHDDLFTGDANKPCSAPFLFMNFEILMNFLCDKGVNNLSTKIFRCARRSKITERGEVKPCFVIYLIDLFM
jgi:hypothetical protein